MIRRNHILAVKRQILPVIHFGAQKIKLIRAIDVFLTCNSVVRELHLLQMREWMSVLRKHMSNMSHSYAIAKTFFNRRILIHTNLEYSS